MRFLLLFILCVGAAQAQDYPTKNVRLIAAAAPGGNPDVLARMLAARLSDTFGRPFVVENLPGAGGIVAAEQVARAAPDGHVLMLGDSGALAINPALNSKLTYNPLRDFTLITALAAVPTVLVAGANVPANSLQEFIALAKARPGALSYGSAGNGSVHHLTMAVFAARAGIDMLHVPYKGSGPAVTDTLAGQTQVMFPSIVAANQFIKAGKLRALAVTGNKRSPLYPSLPTIAEAGVPGFQITQWYGFFAPAKTPPAVVDRLNNEIVAIMKEPDTKKKFADLGADIVTNTPAEFGKFVQSEYVRWGKFIKESKITAD